VPFRVTSTAVRFCAAAAVATKPYGPDSGSGAVIFGAGAVWISAHDIKTVWRLAVHPR